MTEYVVLMFTGAAGLSIVDSVKARDGDAAIQQVVTAGHPSRDDDGGTYVAVPSRSWNPRRAKIEVEERVRLGTP